MNIHSRTIILCAAIAAFSQNHVDAAFTSSGTPAISHVHVHAPKATLLYGLYDDEIEPEPSKRLWNTARLFKFDDNGNEVNDLLTPSDKYSPSNWISMALHVEAYPRLEDEQVLMVAEKTKCHPIDADLALLAKMGDTMAVSFEEVHEIRFILLVRFFLTTTCNDMLSKCLSCFYIILLLFLHLYDPGNGSNWCCTTGKIERQHCLAFYGRDEGGGLGR